MTVTELISWLNTNAKPNDVVKCLEPKPGTGFYDDEYVYVPAKDYHLCRIPSGEVWIGDK